MTECKRVGTGDGARSICSTRCGMKEVPVRDCTVWSSDITCPECMPPLLPPPVQKRRRLVKVAD